MLDDPDIDCIVAVLREMARTEDILRLTELERRVRNKRPSITYENILWLLDRDEEWWQRRGERLARLAAALRSPSTVH